jgi:hypothetical protein
MVCVKEDLILNMYCDIKHIKFKCMVLKAYVVLCHDLSVCTTAKE